MIAPDAPTLGAIMDRHENAARRAAALWRMRMHIADTESRSAIGWRLGELLDGVTKGRRLDCIAAELRVLAADLVTLADECDRAVQRRFGGGWPLRHEVGRR